MPRRINTLYAVDLESIPQFPPDLRISPLDEFEASLIASWQIERRRHGHKQDEIGWEDSFFLHPEDLIVVIGPDGPTHIGETMKPVLQSIMISIWK